MPRCAAKPALDRRAWLSLLRLSRLDALERGTSGVGAARRAPQLSQNRASGPVPEPTRRARGVHCFFFELGTDDRGEDDENRQEEPEKHQVGLPVYAHHPLDRPARHCRQKGHEYPLVGGGVGVPVEPELGQPHHEKRDEQG